MVKPIDILGWGPTRELVRKDDGDWILKITPSAMVGGETVQLDLTDQQRIRFERWAESRGLLIQDALPDLTDEQREMIVTGLSTEVQKEIFREPNKRFVSLCCEGERCFCGEPAEHKVEETIFHDDPSPIRHPLTSYVCHPHFVDIMGEAAEREEDR